MIVDPCHGTGRRSLVKPMALAGLAAGADGLMVEVHPNPDAALSDGYQTITPSELGKISRISRAMLGAIDEAEALERDHHLLTIGARDDVLVAASAD